MAHTIEIRDAAQRVRVTHHGTVLADSRRPKVLYETGYPPRHYLPPEDVRTDLLTPSATRTHCPFKGDAAYWSARESGTADLVWAYAEPLPSVAGIRDHLCFPAEHAALAVEVIEG